MPAAAIKRQKTQSYCYSRQDLHPFNLLERPVWVFDIENRAMWWANTAAVQLWNADSLEEVLQRDFASDMSQATQRRIDSYLDRFKKGESFSEQVCL